MTLDQLRAFVLVVELENLKQAALRVHRTPAALSQSIKQLESLVGLPLLSRQNYRLKATEQGRQFYHLAKSVLEKESQLKRWRDQMLQGVESQIRLVFDSGCQINNWFDALHHVQECFPDTELILQEENVIRATQMLIEGEADVAISPWLPNLVNSPTVQHQPIDKMELVNVISPKLLERCPNGLSTVEQLAELNQVLLKEKSDLIGRQELSGHVGRRRWYVNDTNTKKEIILAGLGWGKLPYHTIDQELKNGTLIATQIDGYSNRAFADIHIIRKNQPPFGRVASELWDRVIELAAVEGAYSFI